MTILDSAMGLIGFERKAARTSAEVEAAIELGSYTSPTINTYQAFKYYQQSSAVAIAVEMIASKVESMLPVVRQGDELSDAHPVLDLLKRPNPLQTRKQFIGDIARHYLISGNAFMVMMGAQRARTMDLWPIHPVGVMPEATFNLPWPEAIRVPQNFAEGSYRAEERDGQVIFIDGPLREIAHIKGFCTRTHSVLGDSPLESILNEIEQQIEGKKHNVSLLQNGGRPSLIFNFKNQFTTYEALRDAIEFLKRQVKGAKNAGAVLGVNGEELEITETSTNNKDMDYAILEEASRSVVFSRYQIPLPLVTASRQTHSNFKEAVVAFYYDAVIPTFEAVYQQVSRPLLRRTRGDQEAEVTYDPHQIPAIHEEMLEEANKLAALAILTVNEQRAKLPDTDPIEGGDTVLAPSSLQPVAGEGVNLAEMIAEDRAMQEEMARSAMESDGNENKDDGASDA